MDSALDIIMQGGELIAGDDEASAYVNRIEDMFPLTPADVDRAIKTTLEEYEDDDEEETA